MSPAKIFIVEDDASDIYILRRALAAQGEEFELEVAGDGEQALRCVSRLRRSSEDSQPGVILLDLHLPKYDGMEVLRAIRQEPVVHGNHVVVMTSSASPQELAELRKMGVDCRLKPRGLAEFAELAADLISICRELDTAGQPAR